MKTILIFLNMEERKMANYDRDDLEKFEKAGDGLKVGGILGVLAIGLGLLKHASDRAKEKEEEDKLWRGRQNLVNMKNEALNESGGRRKYRHTIDLLDSLLEVQDEKIDNFKKKKKK